MGKKTTDDEPISVKIGPDGKPVSKHNNQSGEYRGKEDEIYALFMASPHVEWAPFCKSHGWNPQQSRNFYPTGRWTAEKKRQLAIVQAEHIGEALFNHRSNWHKDVLKTLNEYPAANDAMLGILKRRMNDIIEDINADTEARRMAIATGSKPPPRAFEKYTTLELNQLAHGMKAITEAKHRSLCLNDWKVKLADEAANSPQMLGAPPDESDAAELVERGKWVVELTGGEQLTPKRIQELTSHYLDKPGEPALPRSPIVEAAAEAGLDMPIKDINPDSIEADDAGEYA